MATRPPIQFGSPTEKVKAKKKVVKKAFGKGKWTASADGMMKC